MSGDEGELGLVPGGAVSLEQRPKGHANKQPRAERQQERPQQAELGAAGDRSRPIHRLGILTVFMGMSAALVAWALILVWALLWLWDQLPLV